MAFIFFYIVNFYALNVENKHINHIFKKIAIYRTLLALFLFLSVISCKKNNNIIDIDEAPTEQNTLTDNINHWLGNAPNGWILYIPNLDTAIKTAIPIVLKFDTVKKIFQSTSPFPASASPIPSFYEVSSATDTPLLSFSSGSIFSNLYESGLTSDYSFKIIDAGADTIHMQPYRKGLVYASEGGLPMKMIRLKDPFTLFNKPYTPVQIESALTAGNTPSQNLAAIYQLKLTYTNGYASPLKTMAFLQLDADSKAFFQSSVPFCRYLQTTPIYVYINHEFQTAIACYFGDNMLITLVQGGFNPQTLFQSGPSTAIQLLKTNYMLIRSIDNEGKKVNLYALDVNGKEIITGTLERP